MNNIYFEKYRKDDGTLDIRGIFKSLTFSESKSFVNDGISYIDKVLSFSSIKSRQVAAHILASAHMLASAQSHANIMRIIRNINEFV